MTSPLLPTTTTTTTCKGVFNCRIPYLEMCLYHSAYGVSNKCYINLVITLKILPTTIPCWKHQFSSDHRRLYLYLYLTLHTNTFHSCPLHYYSLCFNSDDLELIVNQRMRPFIAWPFPKTNCTEIMNCIFIMTYTLWPGAIPPLPQYVLMAWCSLKPRDNFTFIFTRQQPR